MRIDGAGLVENDMFAKTLRILAYPKNVAIDFHLNCRILKNALRMLPTLSNADPNNANALQT